MTDLIRAFGRVGWVSGSQSDEADPRAGSAEDTTEDVLADKLLAVQRVLATLNADSEVQIRLNLRFMAICTSLKMPGASAVRGINRLDRLMADAKLAQRGQGKEV
jgi:hypothetical protein